MDTRTTEQAEMKDAFNLAFVAFRYHLALMARAEYIQEYTNDEFENKLRTIHRELKVTTVRLGIDVPIELTELPQVFGKEETEQFVSEQSDYILNGIIKKGRHVQNAYAIGKNLAPARGILTGLSKNERFKAEDVIAENLNDTTALAKDIGVDVSKEVQQLRDENLNNEDAKHIIEALVNKICGFTPVTSTKRSEVNPAQIINDEYWAISLVRLPDRNNNEHAFLVLEGNTAIWFIDFVAAENVDLYLPGLRDGKVRIKKFESQETDGLSSKLLFQCRAKLMDIQRGERLLYSTWPISKHKAEDLLQKIVAQQNKPPKYNILGDSALARSSARSSSNPTGHNCFTFARKMLLDLNDEYIQLPRDKLGDWIYSATSRSLVDWEFERKKWKEIRLPLLLAFLSGAVIVAIIALLLHHSSKE